MSQQINLYNPLLLKQQKLFSLKTMAQGLGLILAGGLLFAAYAAYNAAALEKRAADAKRMHGEALAQIERLRAAGTRTPSKLLQEEVARQEAQLKARQAVVALLQGGELGNKQGFSEYFRALSRQTGDGLWLTRFRVAGSGEVSIGGGALNPELVPAYIAKLKRETVFAGKTFSTLEMRVADAAAAGGKAGEPRHIEFSLHHAEAKEVR